MTLASGAASVGTTSTDGPDQSLETCCWRLYDAECAAHDAHRSQVRSWIVAAEAKLHEAVLAHRRALDSAESG